MQSNIEFDRFYVDSACHKQVIAALEQNGLVTFDGIRTRGELLTLAKALGTIIQHRDAEEDKITRIFARAEKDLPKESNIGLTSSHLMFHTDGSSHREPVTLVLLWCVQPAQVGGYLFLSMEGRSI